MKSELGKRCKGLLALVLCCGMLFGNSMLVRAAESYMVYASGSSLYIHNSAGQSVDVVEGGAGITVSGGTVVIRYSDAGIADCTLDTDPSTSIPDTGTIDGSHQIWTVASLTSDAGITYLDLEAYSGSTVKKAGGGGRHIHNCDWSITIEPTRTEDGVASYICNECGYVKETQPVSFGTYYLRLYRGLLKNAETNSTVIFEADGLPCISDVMLECNLERSDVTVVVYFTHEGVKYELTIPAGTDFSAIQNDTESFYGYLGLAAKLGLTANVIS